MQLFRRTLLQGAHDRLVDAGRMLPFANEKLATEVFDKIASDMGIPPILSERPNQQQALALGNSLIDYSQKLAANGHGPDNELMGLAKQASTKDPVDRALVTAEYYIQKAAEEGSIRDSGGTGLLAAGGHDPMARLDLMNRATGAYAVQQGQSNFPMPGVLGRELAAPGAPGTGANVSQKIAAGEPGFADNYPRLHQFGQGLISRPGANLNIAQQAHATHSNLESMARMSAESPAAQAAYRAEGDAARSLRNVRGGALAAQGLGAAAGLATIGLGARALYRHFNPEEKQVQASEKVALDMPDFGKAWESIKGRARSLKDSVASVPGSVRDSYNNFGTNHPTASAFGDALRTDPRLNVSAARNAHNNISHYQNAAELAGAMGMPEMMLERKALSQNNALQRNIHGGAAALQGLAGLGVAGGLAYGGKKLYDHLQGSPEDMEVNASDDGIGALAQALQEHGIEPTPELLAELHEAMEAEEGGGGGSEMPPGAPSGQEPPKQAAEGSLHPTPPGNKLTGAAAHDPIAALDVKNRAPGSYKVPQGQTQLSTASGTIGDEKKASENAWRQNIVKTAQEWGPHLPASWPDNVKHAAIQNIAAQPPAARLDFVKSLLSR